MSWITERWRHVALPVSPAAASRDAACAPAPARVSVLRVHVHEERTRLVDRVLAGATRSQVPVDELGRTLRVHLCGEGATALGAADLRTLMAGLGARFGHAFDPVGTVDVDPRTVDVATLERLVVAGFRDVRLLVSDLDADVQRATDRLEPTPLVLRALGAARALGARTVEVELDLGLPCQRRAGFERTLALVAGMRPDTVSLADVAQASAGRGGGASGTRPDARVPCAGTLREMRASAHVALCGAGYAHVAPGRFSLDGKASAAERVDVVDLEPGAIDIAGLDADRAGIRVPQAV